MLSLSIPCFTILVAAVLVARCGGGDDGGGEPAQPAEVVTEPSAEEPAAAGPEAEARRILAVAPLPVSAETTYVVEPGDTLGSIAAAFGTTVAAIVELNGIANPDAIFVGQVFRIARSSTPPLLPRAPVSTDLEAVDLVKVIDGDTIEVRLADGSTAQVRYLGIDAPETDPDQGGAEPWGLEATAKNADLLSGGRVYVEADISDRDESGRWLRYVWVEGADGSYLLVSAALVALGLAQVSALPPNTKHVELYEAAQDEAQAARIGIWGEAAPAEAEREAAGGQGEADMTDSAAP